VDNNPIIGDAAWEKIAVTRRIIEGRNG
jgi:hypothetical protein